MAKNEVSRSKLGNVDGANEHFDRHHNTPKKRQRGVSVLTQMEPVECL
jgi:hypothetical protein